MNIDKWQNSLRKSEKNKNDERVMKSAIDWQKLKMALYFPNPKLTGDNKTDLEKKGKTAGG